MASQIANREIKNHEKLAGLSGAEIHLSARANTEGHLFAAVHEKEIKEKIYKEKGVNLDDIEVLLNEPLKTVGLHNIELQNGKEKTTISVIIEAIT